MAALSVSDAEDGSSRIAVADILCTAADLYAPSSFLRYDVLRVLLLLLSILLLLLVLSCLAAASSQLAWPHAQFASSLFSGQHRKTSLVPPS